MTPELIAGGGGSTRSVQQEEEEEFTLSGAALRSLKGPGGASASSSDGGGGSGGGASPSMVDRRSLRGPDITSGSDDVESQVRDVDMASLAGATGGATIRDRRSNSDASEQQPDESQRESSSVSDRLLSTVSSTTPDVPDEPVESVKEGAASVREQFQAPEGVTASGLSGGGDDDSSSSPKEVFAKGEGDTGGGNLFNKLSAAGAQSGVPGLQGASRAGRANVYEYVRKEREEGGQEEVRKGETAADEFGGAGRAADYLFDNPAVNVQRGSRRTYNVATGRGGEEAFTEDVSSAFQGVSETGQRGVERLRSEEREQLTYFEGTPAEVEVSSPGPSRAAEATATTGDVGRRWFVEEPAQGISKTVFGVDPRSGERNVDPSTEDVVETAFSAGGPFAGAPGVVTAGTAKGYKGLGRLAGRAGSSETTEEVTEQVTKAGSRAARGAPDDGGIKQSMVNPLRAVRAGARATADRLPSRVTDRLPTRSGSGTTDDFSRQVGGGGVSNDFLNTRGTGPVEVESTVSSADEFTRQSATVADDTDLVRAAGDADDPAGLPVVRDEVTSSGDPLVRGGDVAGERGAQVTDDLTSTPDNLPVSASRFGEDAAGGARGGTRRASSSTDEFTTDQQVSESLDEVFTGRGPRAAAGTAAGRVGAGAAGAGATARGAGDNLVNRISRSLDRIRSRGLRNEPPGTARAGAEEPGTPRARGEEPTGRPRGEEPGGPRGRGEEPGRPRGEEPEGRGPRSGDEGGGGGLPGPRWLWAGLGIGAGAAAGLTYSQLDHPQQVSGDGWSATKRKTYRDDSGKAFADLYRVMDDGGNPLGFAIVLGVTDDGTIYILRGVQNPTDQVSQVKSKGLAQARQRASGQSAVAGGGGR
jgi:hypothetical protein